ncbi:PhzF family phenazine biosynthesis protein [Pontibacter locisalis]|uniref:PhzF family phenazine biosynthesis protein n=1 Tax=Pontibacter locisalis TaxID=1719035 RepID=A0ABW5IN85_9BACT
MKLDLYQIDAFTDHIFGGNPACVVPLSSWPADDLLMKIARENAVAETAFFIDNGERIHLRWFTPEIEMDLCGHATLATAHVLKAILRYPKDSLVFDTLSGELTVFANKDTYTLDLPSRNPTPSELPVIIRESLNIQPKQVLKSRDYVLVYETEQEIRNITIDRQSFDKINLDPGGVVVTAPGLDCDFVSRYFTPQSSILEDPVTGSAHCSLVPYWSGRLNKKELKARQLSARQGSLYCLDMGGRIHLSGKAKTYSVGTLWTE